MCRDYRYIRIRVSYGKEGRTKHAVPQHSDDTAHYPEQARDEVYYLLSALLHVQHHGVEVIGKDQACK